MDVNQKGMKGMIKVIDDLTDRGLYVFPAFDDHSPIDLIAVDDNGVVIRLQVKYRQPMQGKKSVKYELHARSVVNGKVVPIDRNMIDGWALYASASSKVVYIPISAMDDKTSMVIDPDRDYGAWAVWQRQHPAKV